MLEKVKMSLRITGDDFDDEINDLIKSALLDIGITDVRSEFLTETADNLILTAVKTYVKLHFGEPDEYDRLKASYDEQKAQLLMSGKYTDYTGAQYG